EEYGIGLVDVVVVNLYPFARAAANPDTPFAALVEEIDIGGPSLVRAAAKNFTGVLVVVDPEDYPGLVRQIDGGVTIEFRFELMRKAFAHTASYDATIARTLSLIERRHDRFERSTAPESRVELTLTPIRTLRYGENPHQPATWYAIGGSRLSGL